MGVELMVKKGIQHRKANNCVNPAATRLLPDSRLFTPQNSTEILLREK